MSEASKPKAKHSELRETITVIIEALVIALIFRSFLYQPFSIPTASLQPTLMIGDYVIASKFTWGFGRYSLPLGIIPFEGRIFGREPNRGDIAVFRPVPQRDNYIKRVIGLPGDRIQMKGGRLFINDVQVERELVGRGTDTDSYGTTIPVLKYRETLPNGVSYLTLDSNPRSRADFTQEYLVPEGHYFVMGDNRDNSNDSRYWCGVPKENLVGRAFAVWMNWDPVVNVRWSRMFKSIK